MRQVLSPVPALKDFSGVVTVEKGGTNAGTYQEAMENLGVIPRSSANTGGGPVLLNQQNQIPASARPETISPVPTLLGELVSVIGVAQNYTITNYSEFNTYEVSVSSGTVSRTGNTITFTPPGAPTTVTLTVNNNSRQIPVVNPRPAKPVISAPMDKATNVNRVVDIVSSAFSLVGASGTHLNSDWEIATDKGFTNLVSTSYADTTNLTTWQSANLIANTTHYLRVRYRNATWGAGPWSSSVEFKTKVDLVPTVEELRTSAVDPAASALYGIATAISKDGFRIVIGASGAAAVYIYRRTANGWVQEQKIQGGAGGQFGRSVAINQDGSKIVIGAPYESGAGFNQSGVTYFYTRTGTTWAISAGLTATYRNVGDHTGTSVAINDEGTWAISGAPDRDTGRGGAVVFMFNGGVWSQSGALTIAGFTFYARMGASVTIDGSGTYAVLGSPGINLIKVWKRVGGGWTPNNAPSTIAGGGDSFGASVAISNDGTTLAVGYPGGTVGAFSQAGRVAIYERTGDDFIHKRTIESDVPTASGRFGTSVSLSQNGRVLLIGEPNEDSVLANSGAGHIIVRNASGAWVDAITSRNKLKLAAPAANTNFGSAVAISSSGDRAVLGFSANTVSGFANAGSMAIFN